MGDGSHIEEVHGTEHNDGEADFPAEQTHYIGYRLGFRTDRKRQRDEANVDKVKADDQQMVRALC